MAVVAVYLVAILAFGDFRVPELLRDPDAPMREDDTSLVYRVVNCVVVLCDFGGVGLSLRNHAFARHPKPNALICWNRTVPR